jgi:hypothetical protein
MIWWYGVEWAMVIRDKVGICRFWRGVAGPVRQVLGWMLCVLALNAGAALAAPQAAPGLSLSAWQSFAAGPVISAGFCEEDGGPCPAYEPEPYAAQHVNARRWEPAPEPYVEERTIVHARPDCVEERYAAHPYAEGRPTVPHSSEEVYDESCGVKCWYRKLRDGYCGRGCDYYRFRMMQFREGRLGGGVHVACR